MSKTGGRISKGLTKKYAAGIPVISIITVSFNAEKAIQKTIDSVIRLSYPNVEYIIIDGGSLDGTINLIKKNEDNIDYWMSEQDKGIYDGMNKGIRIASGDWINFMNCGDCFASEHSLNFFRGERCDADIIFGDALIIYPSFKTLLRKTVLKESWKRMPFCHQASFSRADLMKNNPFNLKYRLSSDFDFVYKMYVNNAKFTYVDEIICEFDFTGGASVANVFRSVKERKAIVMSYSFSIVKWTYHVFSIGYVYAAFYVKRIIGSRITNWVTRVKSRI